MSRLIDRREMLCSTTLAGAGVWLSHAASSAADRSSPNEKLNIALIGAGGRGGGNLPGVAKENIVALCDVDDRRAAATYAKYPSVPKFHDYRQLLNKLDKQIDAVVISAPNHIHAPASLMAMKMGKHCYCEKPLSHSVHESRLVARVAREQGVATQMGTQIHASDNFRRVVELVQSGAIGPIREMHIQLSGDRPSGDRPQATPPVPSGLKWDLWLGPAPYRPYHPCYVPHDWHCWWDFGGGTAGQHGVSLPGPSFLGAQLAASRDGRGGGSAGPCRQHTAVADSALAVPCQRPVSTRDGDVESSEGSPGVLAEARSTRLGLGSVCRCPRHASGKLPAASTVACGAIRRLSTARPVSRSVARSSPRMDPGLQDRQPDAVQFRLLRRRNRGRPAGQRGLPMRKENQMGRRESARYERARGEPVSAARIPAGVDGLMRKSKHEI